MADHSRINWTIDSTVKSEFEEHVPKGERSQKVEELITAWLENNHDFDISEANSHHTAFQNLQFSPKQQQMLNLVLQEAPNDPTGPQIVKKSKKRGIYQQTGSAKSTLKLFERIDSIPISRNGSGMEFHNLDCRCGASINLVGLVKNNGECPKCNKRVIAEERMH